MRSVWGYHMNEMEHESRVRDAFDALHQKIEPRLDDASRGSLESLRGAAADRDADRLRDQLTSVQEKHGWLYRELAEHPEVSTLLNELALWGF
ncbi:MAG: hypothetical protein ABI592_05685 [Acidobacteriota bacterium]